MLIMQMTVNTGHSKPQPGTKMVLTDPRKVKKTWSRNEMRFTFEVKYLRKNNASKKLKDTAVNWGESDRIYPQNNCFCFYLCDQIDSCFKLCILWMICIVQWAKTKWKKIRTRKASSPWLDLENLICVHFCAEGDRIAEMPSYLTGAWFKYKMLQKPKCHRPLQ